MTADLDPDREIDIVIHKKSRIVIDPEAIPENGITNRKETNQGAAHQSQVSINWYRIRNR